MENTYFKTIIIKYQNIMKKNLFIFLSLILFGISFSAKAYDFAVSNSSTCTTDDSIYFNITSSTTPYTVEVTFSGELYCDYNKYTGDISIPSTVTYNGITYSVTKIGNCAFYGSSVTRVSTNFNITTIGNSAFWNCSQMDNYTILTPVTYIGSGAFQGCTSLTYINVNTDNPYYSSDNGVLYNKQKDTLLVCPGGLTGTFTVPNFVSTIEAMAFAKCIHLTSIIIPNTVTSMRGGAFMGCSGLTSCTLPNSITRIPSHTFSNCSSLTTYTIPNYITDIGSYAFSGTGLTSLTSLATTPPILEDDDVFFAVPNTIPVYVPCASLSAYQSSQYWSNFTNIQCLSGLNDISNKEIKTTLYPNPATDKAILEVEGLNKKADVIVYDLQGRTIKTYKLNNNQTELEIDVTSYPKGIYNVKVINESNTITKKLIVK